MATLCAWIEPSQDAINLPLKNHPLWLQSWDGFKVDLFSRFDDFDSKKSARSNFRILRQGQDPPQASQSVQLFSSQSGLPEQHYFIKGLKDLVNDTLMNSDGGPEDLFEAQAGATCVDDNKFKTKKEQNKTSTATSFTNNSPLLQNDFHHSLHPLLPTLPPSKLVNSTLSSFNFKLLNLTLKPQSTQKFNHAKNWSTLKGTKGANLQTQIREYFLPLLWKS